MLENIPEVGAAAEELITQIQQVWLEEAKKAGLSIAGFDPNASLTLRLAFVKSHGLEIGGILSRYSTKLQQSTRAQVEECLRFAAHHRL